MKIKIKHMAAAVNKIKSFSKEKDARYFEGICDKQPKAGGQLSALIIREGVPANIARGCM